MKRNVLYLLFLLPMCGLLVSGCQTQESLTRLPAGSEVQDDLFFEKWKALEQDAPNREVPYQPAEQPTVAARSGPADPGTETTPAGESLSPSSGGTTDARLPTTMIENLNLGETTDIAIILRALARAGDVNILIGEGVQGKVMFNFSNVPWNEAFSSLLASAGLSYDWEGSIIRVMSLEDMQKELEVEKVQAEREQVAATLREAEPMQVKVVRVKYTDAAALEATLNKVLDKTREQEQPAFRGSVALDEDNNNIIIRASQQDLDKLVALVQSLDHPKPLVLIEAKIVETNRQTARELGMQWGGGQQRFRGDRRYELDATTPEGFGANFPATLTDDVGLILGLSSERLGGGELLSAQLTALQEKGQLNILSSPSITTLDNVTATIESGEERAYRETSGTGNDLDVSIAWKKAVLSLEVTPHVIDEKIIKMEVIAKKDSFDESRPESNGEFPVNTKNASTTLLLNNAETTVIGGLSQESSAQSEFGVPLVHNIPFLGKLFGGSRRSGELDEILIFITPHILGVKTDTATAPEDGE